MGSPEVVRGNENFEQNAQVENEGRNSPATRRGKSIIPRSYGPDDHRISSEQREKLRGGEAKETILAGARAFTSELIHKYPQLIDGKLNYYIAGSLGVMLLLESQKFEIIDSSRIPEIVSVAEKTIPSAAVQHLEDFVRQIGDLDYVPTVAYKERQREVQDAYGKVPVEEYNRRRSEFIWKGGGGPKIDDLSDTAKKVLKSKKEGEGVMCDPLSASGPDRVARITIDGKDIYIPEPKMMLAYKTVHLAETFDNADKDTKFVSDYNALLKGLGEIYSREDLLQTTHDVIFSYGADNANGMFIPYHNPQFGGEMKAFVEEAILLDPDAHYLEQLQYGKERSIGVLKALHRMQTSEAKHAIVNFYNDHPAQFDMWVINNTSPQNREVIADFVLSRHNLLDDFRGHITSGEVTKDAILEALKSQAWAFQKYGQQMPDQAELVKKPNDTYALDIMMKLHEGNIHQELSDLDTLFSMGVDSQDIWRLKEMLCSELVADNVIRNKLFKGLIAAKRNLDPKENFQFQSALKEALTSSSYYDVDSNKFIKINDAERPVMVAGIFEKFDMKFN